MRAANCVNEILVDPIIMLIRRLLKDDKDQKVVDEYINTNKFVYHMIDDSS